MPVAVENRIDESLLAEAVEIADSAAQLTLRWFQGSGLGVRKKQDGTVVTEADVAAEDLIRSAIKERYPDDAVFGEERGESAGVSGRRWVIDPIDGTISFVHGVPLYSTLLALIDADGPALGVICLPALGETVAAGRGLGAFLNDSPCHVSETDTLSQALLTSSAFDADWWGDEHLLAVASSGAATRAWGDGYGYALVASGRADAMIEPPVKPWDIAPMFSIIPEAGGRITGWDGTPADRNEGGWIASNGRVHDQLIERLATALPES